MEKAVTEERVNQVEIEGEEDVLSSVGFKSIYFNNLVDRYFTRYYLDKGKENEQFVFIHTNGYFKLDIIIIIVLSCAG